MPQRGAARLPFCLALLIGVRLLFAQGPPPQADQIRQVSAKVSSARIESDFQNISRIGNRLSGSPGEARTFDYFAEQAKKLGASVQEDPFTVTVPDPAATGTLAVGDARSPVYPLWPNLVRTSTCHLNAPLLYGGFGSLEELSGHDISGRIVLLEFNCGSNWRNAAKLGAAAVVFLQPRSMTRTEAEAKFSNVPLGIPRFFLPLARAGALLTAAFKGETARLECLQNWLAAKTCNLTATLPGTDPRLSDQPIELIADADSMSVVPGIDPGAESIGGVAALLECARVAASQPHARPLKLVLSGAHSLALLGARNLAVAEFSDPKPPILAVTFDLSSGSRAVGSFGRGWFYEFRDEQETALQQISGNLHDYAVDVAAVDSISPTRLLFVDAVNNGDSRTWKNNIPGKFALDCEPLILAGLNALTFRTVDDSRERADTTLDTLDHVRVSNVVRQIRTSAVLVEHLLNDPLNKSRDDHSQLPLDPSEPARSRLIGGFATLAGQIVSYEPNRSFIPDTVQPNTLACVMGRQKTYMGVRGDYVQYSVGPKAHYQFDGLPTMNSYPGNADVPETILEAFHINPATGAIDLAPTWNLPGFDAYDTFVDITTVYRESPIVVFPSVSVDMYGMVDPQTLQTMAFSRVFDSATGSAPRNFSIFETAFDQRLNPDVDDAQLLFLLPGQRFSVLGGSKGSQDQLVLTNSRFGNEAGIGYTAPGGTPTGGRADLPLKGLFPQIALETATDLDAINATRIAQFKKYRILSPDVLNLEGQAETEIKAGRAAVSKKNWADADRHGRAAWGFALRAHPIIMTTANDVVNGVVFYLFLLIPFSYFVERLVIGESLLIRQLGWVVGFFVASFILLRLIHPAFEIVSNPSMIFIAFVMGALSLTVTFFILGKFERSMSTVRSQQVGVHEVDIRRSSVAMAAFNLGVSNMRRRKARTILTTLTLVVMTFIVLSFTSIVSRLKLDETPSPNPAAYAGLLLRTPGLDPLQLTTYRQLLNEFGPDANVLRRAYYYGADLGDAGVLSLQNGENAIDLRAMVGLDPKESDALAPQAALSAGRWFKPGEQNVTILPEPVAEELKVSPAELGKARVTFAGVPLTVIGIANSSALRGIRDLDGDGLMPADFTLSKDYQQQKATSNQAFRSYVRIDPSQVFIVPTDTALRLGADIRTVAVQFPNPADTRPALQSLMPRLSLNLYAGVPSDGSHGPLEVREFSVQQGSSGVGIGLVVIQLLIAAVFVLNTMIASVYERTREIAIFSSIGLAPNHISMLFFAESLVYGILGAVIGYFCAQATARAIVMTNALPGLTLNFSSTSAVLSAAIVMAVVLGSTIYPARKAAKIAAPAVNEEAFQTEPEGDVWELPLPFSVGATEAGPIARFLEHWLRSYEGYTIGEFVTADTAFSEDGETFSIGSTTWLAPYDLGVSQRFQLELRPGPVPGIYVLDLRLTRLSGDAENWPIVNRRFLANIRKQFLTWRTLAPDQRAPYETPEAA